MEMELGKLFIGGISWDTNEDRLREYFQTFGEVLEAVIMKDRATGRARGFGFIVFADPAIAERVVMQKHMIDGRTVEAKKAVPRDDQNIQNRNNNSIHGSPGPTRTKKIFVGGLASTVTEGDFKKYFDQFGTITDVIVMYDQNTQRPRGFGFITYDSEEAVDRVLLKTFHELNGKMVEVKRAVPKELSPGPNRSPLGSYNYGPSRVSSFQNGHTQGYTSSSVGYGVRIDGRYSPVTVGRSRFSPIGSGYGMGLSFESNLSPSYGGSVNITSYLGYGRGLNPPYGENLNRYSSPIAYGGSNGGNSPILNSPSRSLWGNRNLSYGTNSANSSALGLRSGTSEMDSCGSIGAIWGSPSNLGQGGAMGSVYSSDNFGYGAGELSVGSVTVGYGRSSRSGVTPKSVLNGGYNEAYADIYASGSFYGDSTWQSSSSELEGSGPFGFGLGTAASGLMTKNSAGYVDGYSVTNRQPNRGIAA
ncbi:heterogeneous nuclear ribonucleoprotein 1-like [Mangifera indica]|uniref:heterogeneous nuclear ribonucleoprotein 1-like n=1 Tax=Mangifera indica TaxID=29780 RepID=UPI001CF938A5|nr:heterogeneous nuclear ribonucleoprotein 1-like [Mangifera indica]XP_044512425.1 heterogeneous nuclear ribonucleoprotein 1-like [Mangifera indica]